MIEKNQLAHLRTLAEQARLDPAYANIYHANANPTTVLDLLDMIAQQRADLKKYGCHIQSGCMKEVYGYECGCGLNATLSQDEAR